MPNPPRLTPPTEKHDFWWCVIECAMNRELVANYDRLYGASMGRVIAGARSPLEHMIDKATGFAHDELMKFAAFVYEFVWTRLSDEAFAQEVANG